MRLWSTEMVATERGLEMVLKMLSLVSVYVVFCCHGQCLLRKLTLVLGKSNVLYIIILEM